MAEERIHKIIARAGVTSRRKAEELILEGRVAVNGRRVTTLGTTVDPEKTVLTVDGKRINPQVEKIYVMVNKPRGYISSITDPQGRPTVVNLVKHLHTRVYPVGRLDYDAEGLLVLTNDGDLANRLLHPGYQVPRTYLVKVKGRPTPHVMRRLRAGVRLSDGPAVPLHVSFSDKTDKNSWISITVAEGRNNLIKRIFEAVGHRVLKLKRIRFGTLFLGDLAVGAYRELEPREVKKLKAVTSGKQEVKRKERGARRSNA